MSADAQRIAVSSSILPLGDDAIVTFVCDTFYSVPPVMRISHHMTGSAVASAPMADPLPGDLHRRATRVRWWATNSDGGDTTYGNVRGAAALAPRKTIIVAGAYGNFAYAMNADGRVEWRVQLGYEMFPQWASPVVFETYCIVPRYDGFLHFVDLPSQRRLVSVYLGQHSAAGLTVRHDEQFSERGRYPEWQLPIGDPLVSTPVIVGSLVFQGSKDGWMYALSGLL